MVCIIYMNNTEINTVDRTTVETTSTQSTVASHPNRAAIINILAVAGFIALVAGALWLALNSTRFIPTIVNGIGSAAVYIGSVFVPSPAPANIAVVPTASTTISFGTPVATSTAPVATTTAPVASTTPVVTKPTPKPVATGGTYTVVQGTTPTYSGLPDLSAHIDVIGYLTSADTSSFVGGGSVPAGERPAVKFTVKNVGTNWSGTWRFTASIPTRTSYTFKSDIQPSLAPGDSIEYILGFDRPSKGSGQTVTITVNSDNTVQEANTNNNVAKADLTIN